MGLYVWTSRPFLAVMYSFQCRVAVSEGVKNRGLLACLLLTWHFKTRQGVFGLITLV